MKILTSTILIFLQFVSFADYEVEKKIWDQLKGIYLQTGVDLEKYHADMENYLIIQGHLPSAGNDKAKNYKKMMFGKRLTEYPDFIENIRNEMVSFSMAFELYYLYEWSQDSSRVMQSRIYSLKEALKNKTELTIDDYHSLFKEQMISADFNESSYRFMATLVMINVAPFNSNANIMEAKAPETVEVGAEDILSISLNKNDSLFCNGRSVNADELNVIAKDHLFSRKETAVIVILYSAHSTYDYYMEVFEGLKGANQELRNELARTMFKASYESLSASDQARIKEVYPFIVTEVEQD